MRILQLLTHKLHGFDRIHVGEVLAQDPHTVQRGLVLQQVVATGTAGHDVHGGEYALVGQAAIELQLHIARTLELFEYHLVHLRTRVGQRRGQNGETTAVFDVASGTEEAFRLLQGIGIDTT